MEAAEFGIFFVPVTIAILFDSGGEMDSFSLSNISHYDKVQYICYFSNSLIYFILYMKYNCMSTHIEHLIHSDDCFSILPPPPRLA